MSDLESQMTASMNYNLLFRLLCFLRNSLSDHHIYAYLRPVDSPTLLLDSIYLSKDSGTKIRKRHNIFGYNSVVFTAMTICISSRLLRMISSLLRGLNLRIMCIANSVSFWTKGLQKVSNDWFDIVFFFCPKLSTYPHHVCPSKSPRCLHYMALSRLPVPIGPLDDESLKR
jgi:hypothetical protein